MYALHQAHFLIEKHLSDALAKKDTITFSQFLVLLALSCQCSKRSTQREIADFLFLTEATVSRHIGTLVDAGYLERSENPESRRENILTLTRSGTDALAVAQTEIDARLTAIFDGVPQDIQQHAQQLFDRIIRHLDTDKEE